MGPRLINWPRLLADFVGSRRDEPWSWGGHDCALFAADAVKAISGVDHAAIFRGGYSSASGALEALLDYLDDEEPGGEGPLEAAIAGIMNAAGVAEIEPENAGRGATALIAVENRAFNRATGVVIGGGLVALASDPGVVFRPIGDATRAWST